MEQSTAVIKIDLGGCYFDIEQDFIDKYPESVFAKSLELTDREDGKRIEIDRSGKYFSRILRFAHDKRAIDFSQLSHIAIRRILGDAKYFGIDELVTVCEYELTVMSQVHVDSAPNEESLKEMLADETRLVIILDLDSMILKTKAQKMIERALKLVDRDRCLIVGCGGPIKKCFQWRGSVKQKVAWGMYMRPDPENAVSWSAYLCDPQSSQIISAASFEADHPIERADLIAMVLYANTLHPYAVSHVYEEDKTTELETQRID